MGFSQVVGMCAHEWVGGDEYTPLSAVDSSFSVYPWHAARLRLVRPRFRNRQMRRGHRHKTAPCGGRARCRAVVVPAPKMKTLVEGLRYSLSIVRDVVKELEEAEAAQEEVEAGLLAVAQELEWTALIVQSKARKAKKGKANK